MKRPANEPMSFNHGCTRMNTDTSRCESSCSPHQGLRLPLLRSERRRGAGRGGAPQGWAARHGEAPLSPALSPFVPHGARETEALLVSAGPARTFATIDRNSAAHGAAAAGRALECGDLSPLSRGDLSPSDKEAGDSTRGRSRLAPAPARPRDRSRTEVRRRQVACAKAVTSHRTPKLSSCDDTEADPPDLYKPLRTLALFTAAATPSAPLFRRNESVFAKVRAIRTVASVSLSSVRNGGEGRGEEALRKGDTVRVGGHPSPRPSPRSCLTGRGRRTRYSLQRLRHDLSQRLIFPHFHQPHRKPPGDFL